MTTYAIAGPQRSPLFAASEDDVEEARREIFSALTEVVSGEGQWSEQSAARIRTEGMMWAARGGSVDELLALVRTMTRRLLDRCLDGRNVQDALIHEVMALRLGDAGRRVTRELSCGFFQEGDRNRHTPPPRRQPAAWRMPGQSAEAYAVLAVRAPETTVAAIDTVFRRHAGSEVVILPSVEGVYVLVPADDQEQSVAVAGRAHPDLDGDAWIAVHWQPSTQARSGQTVVDDICATLLALHFPPGVYGLDDVLVEYGAAETPAVSCRLVKIVEPLLEHPVLWETLSALIAADGVRHRACERLGIHRNTLDRRLQRIVQLTGQRPDSLRGLGTLSAALAVHTLMRRQRPVGRVGTQMGTAV
jgi:hypothetical protein